MQGRSGAEMDTGRISHALPGFHVEVACWEVKECLWVDLGFQWSCHVGGVRAMREALSDE